MSVEPRPKPSLMEIYLRALRSSDDHARQMYLDEVCRDDPVIREAAQRMIATGEPSDEVDIASDVPTLSSDGGDTCPQPTIGRYQLLESIGEGGMGIVYRAEQISPIRRTVALKVIKPGMDSRSVIARFEAERQALAMMDHPNIAHVLDAGATDQGWPFFVMELVQGLPITHYAEQSRVPLRERLSLFVEVCRAVQHAHQKGIIHRDLKPSNILVTIDGERPVPKVIDFGIAKALYQPLTDKTLVTAVDHLLGTPLYMSPEQATIDAPDVDTRSDVYSLGVLLYELLTDTTPFTRETLRQSGFEEVRRMIQEVDPPPPSHRLGSLAPHQLSAVSERRGLDPPRLAAAVRGELDWIVMRALEKDRNRRYESVSALAADVQRYLDDEPVHACPPSARYRIGKFARRHRTLMTSVLAVFFAAVGASILLWNERSRTLRALDSERQQRQIAETMEQTARQNADEAAEQRNVAVRNQYVAEIVSGQIDWQRGYIGRVDEKLRRHLPLGGQEDRRGWEWYYLWSLCHPEIRTLLCNASSRCFPEWSPDGELVAHAGTIWRASDWAMVRRLSPSSMLRYRGQWSPNGQWYAWGMADTDRGIYVWDRVSDAIERLSGHTSSVWVVAWSPDGRWLASAGIDRKVLIWDWATRQVIQTLPATENVSDLEWSPEGSTLLVATDEKRFDAWDTATWQLAHSMNVGPLPGARTRLSWHPEGHLFSISTESAWSLIRRSDWSILRTQPTTLGRCMDHAFSPDGALLAIADGGQVEIWDPAGEAPRHVIKGHGSRIAHVDWAPDGRRLVTGDSTSEMKIWDLAVLAEPSELDAGGPVVELAWQDEQTLAAADPRDYASVRWSTTAPSRQATQPLPVLGTAVWSPDHRWVSVCPTEDPGEVLVCDATCGEVIRRWRSGDGTAVTGFAWSPDANTLAIALQRTVEQRVSGEEQWRYQAPEKTIVCWDLWDDRHWLAWTHQGPSDWRMGSTVHWSPSGDFLAIASLGEEGDNGSLIWNGHVYVVDVRQQASVLKHRVGHRSPVSAVAWHPDGSELALGTAGGLIQSVLVPSGRRRFSTHLHDTSINALAWSPDGLRLVSAADDGSVKLLSGEDGADLLTFSLESAALQVAWSPSGAHLAAATEAGKIHLWNAASGRALANHQDRRSELAAVYAAPVSGISASEWTARLRESIRLSPDNLTMWMSRGHIRARIGDFAGAADEFAKGIGGDLSRKYDESYYHALAVLGTGDQRAYRRFCARMLDAFQDSPVDRVRSKVGLLCALVPNGEINTSTLVRLSGWNGEAFPIRIDHALPVAAALFRHRMFDDAERVLVDAERKLTGSPDLTKQGDHASILCLLSLVHHRNGRDQEATLALQKAALILKDRRNSLPWTDLVQAETLLNEASLALEDGSAHKEQIPRRIR